MTIKKIELRPQGDGSFTDVLYPKTSADMVWLTDNGPTLEEFIPNILTAPQRGLANGVASLGSDARIPLTQMPTSTLMETRTSDPVTPTTGRMWLRTDL